MPGIPFLIFLVCGVCFLLSQLMALWSPGRARRAHRISRFFAGLWLIPVALCLVGTVLPDPEHSPGEMLRVALGWFVCFLGALLAVRMCAGGARREAEAEVADAANPGLSRAR